MSDRELLELAAKAAGVRYSGWDREWAWNPLSSDADAFRLAVELRLVIQHAPKYVVVLDQNRDIAEHQDTRENGGDPYAATRRAIVRAAAEIGKGQQ